MKETTLYVFTDATGSQYLGNILFQDLICTEFVDSGQNPPFFVIIKLEPGLQKWQNPHGKFCKKIKS